MRKEIHHNHILDTVALLNGLVGGITLYPQLYLLISSNSTSNSLSYLSFILILLNSIIWFWYGLHYRIKPLVISSLLNTIAAGCILILL